MRYIAHLIKHQGEEFHVSDLYYAINPPDLKAIDETYSVLPTEQVRQAGLSILDPGNAGEILTPEGKKRIQSYLTQLQDRIQEAVEVGDEETQANLEAEQEQVLRQLAADSGLGGRPRRAASPIEQMRKNVTKLIRKKISKIESVFPELGHHLRCIKTGTSCQYAPRPKVEWHLEPF